MKTEKSKNVYEIVTKQILDRMMAGQIPWRDVLISRKGEKPRFRNHFKGNGYSLLNALLLGEPGTYATWNQIKEHGGKVKAGAKSHIVTYWCSFIPKDKQEEAERLEAEGLSTKHLEQQTLRFYQVFNMKDVEGIAQDSEEAPETVQEKASAPTDIADMVISDYTINNSVKLVDSEGDETLYTPQEDVVSVPAKTRFLFEEDWYASLFGGLVGSTAKESRCDRKSEFERLCQGELSVKEALTREIGSSMILTACGLRRDQTHQQISAVCQKWIEPMKRDYRLIVYASSGAEKAAQYILGQFAQ